MIKHYLKIAWRNICKRKGETIIGIVGLSMSIVVFTFCLFTFEYVATLNYKIPNYKNIVEIEGYTLNGESYNSSWNNDFVTRLMRTDIDGIEQWGILQYNYQQETTYFLMEENKEIPYITNSNHVSKGFLDIFSITLKTSSAQEIFKNEGRAILSESASNKIYGTNSPIGSTIRIRDQIYTIAGIMDDIPYPNSISPIPIDLLISIPDDPIPEGYYMMYGLITNKKALPYINKQILKSGIKQDDDKIPQINDQKRGIINPDGKVSPIALTYFAIGFSVLLIGIINFLSINIGTFYNRNKELVLRKIIGGTTSDLFKLLFTELFILISLVFLLTICLTEVFLPFVINNLILGMMNLGFDFIIPTGLLIRSQVWYFIYILLFCSIIAYLAIVRLQKISAMQGFKGKNYNRSNHFFRNCILTVQFFITILFVGITAMLHVQAKSFENSIMSCFSVSEQKRTFCMDLKKEELKGIEKEVIAQISTHPGIEDILSTSGGLWSQTKTYQTQSGKEFWCKKYDGENFTSFFHLSLLAGYPLSEPDDILISKSLFEDMKEEDQYGYLLHNEKSYRIKGVIEDFELEPSKNLKHYFIITHTDIPYISYIKAHPGSEKEVKNHIEKILRQWIPETLPISVITFDKEIGSQTMVFSMLRNAASIFAIICLALTLLGIYTAITLDTEKRQKEVGIRKVNGATILDIATHFGKLYFYIFLISIILIVPVFILICKLMYDQMSMLYNFKNPLFWFTLLIIMFSIILSIIGYRLYKISHTNPAEVIRNE